MELFVKSETKQFIKRENSLLDVEPFLVLEVFFFFFISLKNYYFLSSLLFFFIIWFFIFKINFKLLYLDNKIL